MKSKILIISVILLCLFSGMACADRLPNQTPENQVISVFSVVEVIGSYVGSQTMQWTLDSPGALHTGTLGANEVRGTMAYSENTATNGGYLSETKSFSLDTSNKAVGQYNLQTSKTLTYATDTNTGSVLQASESITMDIMGNSTPTDDVIACPFGPSASAYYPAFCNVVYAKSSVMGMTTGAVSSSTNARMVSATADAPAALEYSFDVKPDESAGTGYAAGTFGTEFGVSIREARGNGTSPSALNVYTDKSLANGLVAKFHKDYVYRSGFRV
jgi:hypothetical protein